jgi:hypothetical protein
MTAPWNLDEVAFQLWVLSSSNNNGTGNGNASANARHSPSPFNNGEHYRLLGVPATAGEPEIAAAFRRLSMSCYAKCNNSNAPRSSGPYLFAT